MPGDAAQPPPPEGPGDQSGPQADHGGPQADRTQPPGAEAEMKTRVLEAGLAMVPELGWSTEALAAGKSSVTFRAGGQLILYRLYLVFGSR